MTVRNTTQVLRYSEFGDPGSWQTFANLSESHIYPAPVSLDNEQAAIFRIHPATAWRMLNDFADLRSGDWIIQNGGRVLSDPVRGYPRHLRTANLVRNLEGNSSLEEINTDLAVEDSRDAVKILKETIGPNNAHLGLIAAGGTSALTICKRLADQSALATYGGMDREPIPFAIPHVQRSSSIWLLGEPMVPGCVVSGNRGNAPDHRPIHV